MLDQPGLEGLPLPSILRAYPAGQLRDDDRARVAALLLLFEAGDDLGVTVPLGRLADDVGVEETWSTT